jgi:hypothetical protein
LARSGGILKDYEAHLPLTCRQIYYRMIGQWGHEKGDTFQRSLYGALNSARRNGSIPFEYIRDDGILGGGFQGYRGLDDFWRGQEQEAAHYRRDRQANQSERIQVWCESAGMVPQLERVADGFSIPVYSSGGFNSLTAIRQIVSDCTRAPGSTTVLHLGDCDPSGFSIFQCVFEDVATFLEHDREHPGQTFHAESVATTFGQIEEFDLEADEITSNDSRARTWRALGYTHSVQLEAMPPDKIADLLRSAIIQRLDHSAIEAIHHAEDLDRAVLANEASEIAEIRQRRRISRVAW